MSLSRRQFIKASGVALCAGAAPLAGCLFRRPAR
ncbi:twin-arginine translocation signal domain-containing protein, partial [Klebsiella pneumoniae]